jgi:hypothetical protein
MVEHSLADHEYAGSLQPDPDLIYVHRSSLTQTWLQFDRGTKCMANEDMEFLKTGGGRTRKH